MKGHLEDTNKRCPLHQMNTALTAPPGNLKLRNKGCGLPLELGYSPTFLSAVPPTFPSRQNLGQSFLALLEGNSLYCLEIVHK